MQARSLIGGRTITVGSPALLLDAVAHQSQLAVAAELEEAGRTAVVVLRGQKPVGVLGVADRLRPDAGSPWAGSDLAPETADAVVVRDEPAVTPSIVQLSRTARRLLVQTLVIAVLVVWDLTGTLPLPLGVAGHEGSTVIVGLNGLSGDRP